MNNTPTVFKDGFGQEIKVKDVVVFGAGYRSAGINTGLVTKFTPIQVTIGYGYHVPPQGCLIITDKFIAEKGQKAYDDLLEQHKGHIDETPQKTKKVTPKYRMSIYSETYGRDSKCKFVVTVSTDDGLDHTDELKEYFYRAGLERHKVKKDPTQRWGQMIPTGDAEVGGYYGRAVSRELPVKLVKRVLGYVPVKSIIVCETENYEEMEKHLHANNVHGKIGYKYLAETVWETCNI